MKEISQCQHPIVNPISASRFTGNDRPGRFVLPVFRPDQCYVGTPLLWRSEIIFRWAR
jgi:hypothetical protein